MRNAEFSTGPLITDNERRFQDSVKVPSFGSVQLIEYIDYPCKSTLERVLSQLRGKAKHEPNPANILIVCVLRMPMDDVRADIKAWSDTVSGGPGPGLGSGVATQVCCMAIASKSN